MTKLAFITLSGEGARLFDKLDERFPGASFYVHEKVKGSIKAKKFAKVLELTEEIFGKYSGLVFIAPCGAVVRALAGQISGKVSDKKTDPAVVQVDVGGRYAVSLLSGHEGGANGLAVDVANAIGAEPVISTTTEAVKNFIVGVGCKKGKESQEIIEAVKNALNEAGAPLDKVRMMASVDIKAEEAGLIQAAKTLGVPLRFIASDEIKNCAKEFARSEFVEQKVNLPAVAEPAALIAGRRTKLVLTKRKYDGVTVAIARENLLSLE